MQFHKGNRSSQDLLTIYKQLVYPRYIEEKMLKLLRQGRVSKWFSGIGQEAIAVGATLALDADEWMMTMHRNLGVFTTRNVSFEKLFLQWQGKKDGFSRGRERSFHFGSAEHHICGMISHLGPQLSVAGGAALAKKLKGEKKVALAFTGEGGTSQGEFHEAMNVAAVWNLPVIFIIENNGYGLSTPTEEQYVCKDLADRAKGYGMASKIIDGNNILEVLDQVEDARNYCIAEQKPILIECKTFRMRGHEEASGVKYVPQELFDLWEKKDPIKNFEQFLLEENILTEDLIEQIHAAYIEAINADVETVLAVEGLEVNTDLEMAEVFAPHKSISTDVSKMPTQEMKMVHAIQDGLKVSMENTNLILMGQDIAGYGGVFKITEGFVEAFGKDRVRNTPLCESAILGAALGLSLEGYKSMVEMQFADFVSVGMTQIVNNFAKIHYRWGQNADVVVRMPTGAGVGAGPFHSQSNETWFTHTAGLKVVYPSTAQDAKGLLIASIEDPNPVMYFEHKALYRSVSGQVPIGHYTIEIGKARKVQDGEDVSIITYGAGVHWAQAYALEHPELSIAILDLRTLSPLDYEAIEAVVKETNKVLILHEDNMFGGLGGEISAWIMEHCFSYLDAPVMRCASLDTPIPFAIELENNFLAKNYLDEKVQALLAY
jgi:2-oxoisovalerate dehydrogenase E1 component